MKKTELRQQGLVEKAIERGEGCTQIAHAACHRVEGNDGGAEYTNTGAKHAHETCGEYEV